MLKIEVINTFEDFKSITKDEFIDLLFVHLDRFGDPRNQIEDCLNYALSTEEGKGGFALAAFYDGNPVGALIMNKTGMGGYIPENILVYIAVNSEYRGKGIGRQIIEKSAEIAEGDIKLHVEYDNPAKRLYERVGFTNKYAEMRFPNPKTK
jgi:GNAT superfamily N-acetyltransferase